MSELKICHIADIHFRGLTRHNEYKNVFNDFFIKMSDIKPDIIYIGGDIFHTKTQNISPEIVSLLGWWFTQLASLSHVVITLGNHDGNLMNKNRADAISPIIDLLNNPNISLYKKSGTYKSHIPNLNWCVFSCFDEDGWSTVKPVEGELNIACFHGPVQGSKTESNFNLTGHVDINFFNDYDFGLLGDIHKMQFLAYRDCLDGNRKPWLAYCGSTIQQNYAEDPEHGFLLWTIRSRDDFDVQFEALPNPNRFVTLDWSGSVEDIVTSAKKFQVGTRFRIRSQHAIPQAEWRALWKTLHKKCGASEVVSKLDRRDTSENNMQITADAAGDLRNIDTHMKLLREFYVEQIDDDTWEQMRQYVGKCVNDCIEEDVSRNIKWSLDSLQFDNTFAYGEDNNINFAALSGITGIFAQNAMGKSSIIGTLMYTLFNATDRGSLKNLHVINVRKPSCSAIAKITSNGQQYIIDRKSKRQQSAKGIESATTTLDLIDVTSGKSLNGTQRRETELNIRKLIGGPEDFLLTSLAVQGGLKAFVAEGAAQRKTILARFLDMQIFELINEKLKNDSLELKGKIRDMPERDWPALFDKLNIEHAAIIKKISDIETDLQNKRNIQQTLTSHISTFGNVKIVTKNDIIKQQEKVDNSIDKLNQLNIDFARSQKLLDCVDHSLSLIQNVKNNFKFDYYDSQKQKKIELQKLITRLEHELKDQKNVLRIKNDSIQKLNDIPCGDNFPNCKFIRDSYRDKVEIVDIKNNIDNLLNDISKNDIVFKSGDITTAIKKLSRYNSIISRELNCQLRRSKAKHKHDLITHDINSCAAGLQHDQNILAELIVAYDSAKNTDEVVRLKDELQEIVDYITSIDRDRLNLSQQLGRIDQSRESLKQEFNEFILLSKRWRMFDLLLKATSKRGIPAKLLKTLVPIINDEIAQILNGIVDFTIQLELPDHLNSMDVFIDYGDSRRIIELASGMEKMVASIAIRVALINISSLPKTDMLIIDEGFNELDDANVDACGQLLRSLTCWFKNIIIITHLNSLKDVVDNIIDITRQDKNANVQYN